MGPRRENGTHLLLHERFAVRSQNGIGHPGHGESIPDIFSQFLSVRRSLSGRFQPRFDHGIRQLGNIVRRNQATAQWPENLGDPADIAGDQRDSALEGTTNIRPSIKACLTGIGPRNVT